MCSICDQRFTRKGSLNMHIRSVHEEKKPHKCSICDASFAEKGSLTAHINGVHGNLFVCSICDKSFGRKGILHKHMRSVHEENKPQRCTKLKA